MGDTVLSSSTNTEAFLNTLAQRIGRTILRFRDYRNKLGDMVLNDFEYGAILQKIKVMMPEAELEVPYEGAKKMLLVDNVDDKELLCSLLEAMYDELPAPKKKK